MSNHRPSTTRIPGHHLHKATGQGRVRINGRDHYTGSWRSPAADAEYRRLIRDHLGREPETFAESFHVVRQDLGMEELLAAFLEDAQGRYTDATMGRVSKELHACKVVIRHLRAMFADIKATDFGPLKLRALQRRLIEEKLTRKTINQHVKRAVRIFKWGVSRELVPSSVWHALQTVDGVREHETKTQTKRVRPVSLEHVNAVLPLVSRQVAAMIQLQLLTGARSGEILTMRPCDIDQKGPHRCWVYRPQHHKTEHHDHARTIFIGPRGQKILKPFLKGRKPEAFCFSAAEAERQRHEESGHKESERRKARPKKTPKAFYRGDSYRKAIERACEKAGIPKWHPHQLRHAAATGIRSKFGIETSQVALGHASVDITEVYAEKNLDAVAKAISKVG